VGTSEGSTLFTLIRVQWVPLRKRPQFWALMEREGRVKCWRASNLWPDFCRGEAVCQQYR
jgi:hypothetical protein